jgi:hypothetical protein
MPCTECSIIQVLLIVAELYHILQSFLLTLRCRYVLFLENDFKMDTSLSKREIEVGTVLLFY